MCADLFPGFIVQARRNGDATWRDADLSDNAGREFARTLRALLTRESRTLIAGRYVTIRLPTGDPWNPLDPGDGPRYYEMNFRLRKPGDPVNY